MWVADMDFICPEPVIHALQMRVAHGVFGYPGEMTGLRAAIVNHLANLYEWQIAPEDLVFVPGVITGFNMAAHAFAGPQGGILIQPPVYMPFLSVANNTHGILQEAPLAFHQDGFYDVDWDTFQQAITPQTRMFLLCNPHNPVGRVFRREELEHMAEICAEHDLVICSDEIHCDMVYTGHRHIPIAALSPEIAQRTVTLMAPSKTFNIAGLSCSFAVIQNPTLRRQFEHADMGLVHGVNLLGLTAAKAAYEEGQEWLDQVLVYLEENRNYLAHYVKENLPGVKMFLPEGSYLAWLDCREAGIPGKPCEFFIEKAKVGLNDGAAFGKEGEGFARLNFGCPRAMLTEALERMRRALEAKG